MYLRAMYLYNVTIIAENDVSGAVKQYLHTKLFREPNPDLSLALLELLDSPHEGATYCVQLRCHNRIDITAFQANRLTTLQAGLNELYAGKVVFFASTMKYLNE